jgi:glyoxylase-like metal-dependent hydrolase (beta-lactamase superfamily II)
VAVITEPGIVVIDSLPFPDEANQIARFLQLRTRMNFYQLILTHHHMDHVYGLFAFPDDLNVLGHKLCRDMLLEIGDGSLEEARKSDPVFSQVHIRPPTITFDTGELILGAGKQTFRLMSLPGHTPDNIGVFLEDEELLIAGDAVMAIPIIADGDWAQAIDTMKYIKNLAPDTLVQGHGEVILRGEVQVMLDKYIHYLECVHEQATKALEQGFDRKDIWDIPLEACGLERVPLGIASHRLHIANILSIYEKLKALEQS